MPHVKRSIHVNQVNILKNDKKKDEPGAKKHSRGVAFVDFKEHEHAIVALRVLNNNPGMLSSVFSRLSTGVEFNFLRAPTCNCASEGSYYNPCTLNSSGRHDAGTNSSVHPRPCCFRTGFWYHIPWY